MSIEIELQNLRNDLNTVLKQQTEARTILDNLDKEQLGAFSKLKLLDETINIIKQKITGLEQQIKDAH
ncbi:MAG: hypothetical protein KAT52_07890 [Desulfobacterales bacterium]|nr:hypothetical protein [Desulfobacterales bacterium]